MAGAFVRAMRPAPLDPVQLADVTGGLGTAGKLLVGGTVVAAAGLSLANYVYTVHWVRTNITPRVMATQPR